MPYFATSEEWLKESSLLVQARPSTTRVVTKYATKRPSDISSKSRKRKRKDGKPSESTTATDASAAAASEPTPTGALTLKTFDPVSGACLKYRTDKAAEVGRLVAALGRLSKTMATLPDEGVDDMAKAGEETPVPQQQQADAAGGETGTSTPTAVTDGAGGGGGAGNKKKKKKGGKK